MSPCACGRSGDDLPCSSRQGIYRKEAFDKTTRAFISYFGLRFANFADCFIVVKLTGLGAGLCAPSLSKLGRTKLLSWPCCHRVLLNSPAKKWWLDVNSLFADRMAITSITACGRRVAGQVVTANYP